MAGRSCCGLITTPHSPLHAPLSAVERGRGVRNEGGKLSLEKGWGKGSLLLVFVFHHPTLFLLVIKLN